MSDKVTVGSTPGKRERVELAAELGSAASGVGTQDSGRVYEAVLVRPGEWQGKGIRADAEVLRRCASKFDGVASFLNPPPPRPGQHGYPEIERLLAVTENARWDEEQQAIVADYRLQDTDAARSFGRLVDGWLAGKRAGRAVPEIGLSAVPWVKLGAPERDGLRPVLDIGKVDQVDAVYRPAAGGEFVRVLNARDTLDLASDVFSEPQSGAPVIHTSDGPVLLARDAERVAELRRQLAAGQLTSLTIQAVVFVARYPNANCYRFRDEDLDALAASFVGQPFLRDHAARQVDARAGTVIGSRVLREDGQLPAMQQVIEVTRQRDIGMVLDGLLDRFSIGWRFEAITCSVCGGDWFGEGCVHWPGRKYLVRDAAGVEREVLCELIFEQPRGVEVSAVNVPAVEGTEIQELLACGPRPLRSAAATMTAEDGTYDNTTRVARASKEEKMPEELMPVEETPAVESAPMVSAAPAVSPPSAAPQASAAQPAAPVLIAAPAPIVPAPAADPSGVNGMMGMLRESVLEARLAVSGLPASFQRVVRESLPAAWGPGDVEAAIGRVKSAWAEEESRRTVQGVRPVGITGMQDSMDQISEALSALVEGRPTKGGVRPLSGIREAYLLLSGDYEMTGRYHADRVYLANVSSTTMANIVANILNKVVVTEFQTYPRWWEPIVLRDTFNTLQTITWITLGGVGELPVVSEGAAYSELTWDDAAETAAWQKRGGYLGITLEAMDKDDVGRLRNAPRALAQAAWLTLSKSISAIFTQASGVGPNMADTKALFHTDHGNLGTTALSSATWGAVKLAMCKQTELNSGERLGGLTSPRYLLVPPDLENTALTVLASEGLPGTANNDVNPDAEGNTHDARIAAARRRIIVIDLWTDTNNWAAVADPRLYPTIGLGFRYGETPEIFSVASPSSGLMFTNDVMPVKVRWFYAAGPMDYRGLYKANVA